MGKDENFQDQAGVSQIGLTLQKARKERGLSYEDVEQDTKIRVRYLEAMERNDYDTLPGIVYAQGFLKTYANYLDLDGESLAREFKDGQSASSETQGPNTRSVRADRRESRAGDRPGAARFRRRHNRFSPLTIIGAALSLVLLVVVVGVLYFVGLQASRSNEGAEGAQSDARPSENNASQNSDNSNGGPSGGASTEQEKPSPQETGETEAGGEESAEPPPSAEPEPADPPSEPSPPESLTIEVRVEGNVSWLNIEADGNVVFVEVAEPGFVQTFEAEESIKVWSGNAGAVFLSVNGQDYGQLGGSGQTKIQEFNVKNAES